MAGIGMVQERFSGLDLLGSGVVVLDGRGCARFINLAACQLLGLTPRRVLGQHFVSLFLNSQSLAGWLEQVATRAFGQQGLDISLTLPGHEAVSVHCLAVVLEEPWLVGSADAGKGEGGHSALLLELHETDRRRRLEREQYLHEAARGQREMLRNLAHEIRNPLGGIRGAAQLLESDPEPGELREYTSVIIKESDRLQMLLDRLLVSDQSKPRPMAPTNIHEICERVRLLVQAEYTDGLTIERDFDTSLPELQADKEQLIQALLNLVRNAAQAMRGDGHILLKTRIARQVVINRVGYRLALVLHVIDDGPGVPPELMDRIFLPLVSHREGGNGLGLSLAQAFVERHGGSIECESRVGRTDFRILLPLL